MTAVVVGAAAIAATAAIAGILSGTGTGNGLVLGPAQIGGVADAATDASGNIATATTFFWDFMGYSIGAAPGATNASGTLSGGTDCTTLGATCGSSGTKACCGGITKRAFNQASTCGTTFGTSGPKWVEEHNSATHAVVIDDYGTTRIAAASNGASLPQSTLNVVGTSTFAVPTTTMHVTTGAGVQTVACTGKTSTTLTGCSGGTGALATNGHVEDDSSRPLSLPSLGNALQIKADGGDLGRIAITIGTQSADPACSQGLCDSSSDVNGDPMIGGSAVTYYMRAMLWSSGPANGTTFGSCHVYQGLNFSSTCGQDKQNEVLQLNGDDNLQSNFIADRTCGTRTCPNSSSSGSKWVTATAVDTTAHLVIYKVENQVNAACTTPDDSSTVVSCGAGNHEAITIWIDAANEATTPARARVVIENWGTTNNTRGVNTLECGGTHELRLSGLCYAKTYDDALNCAL